MQIMKIAKCWENTKDCEDDENYEEVYIEHEYGPGQEEEQQKEKEGEE